MSKIYKFKNGATLLFKKRKDFNVTAMRAGFFAGHFYNGGKLGLPHLFEHMLCTKTKNRSPEKVVEDRMKVPGFNACTSNETLMVMFSSSNKWVENGFEYSSDCLLNPVFDAEILKNEKNVVLEEHGQLVNKHKNSFQFNSISFAKQYEEMKDNFRLGDEKSVNSFTTTDLENFKDEHYVSDKFIITVCSSLPFSKIKRLTKKYFVSNLKKPSEKSEFIKKSFATINKEQSLGILNQEDKSNFKVRVYFTFDTKIDEFRYDFSLNVLRYLLMNKNNLYFQKARNEGLIYDASIAIDVLNQSVKSAFCFDFTTNKFENIERLFELINENITDIKNGVLTEKDVEDCKDFYHVLLDSENYSKYMEDALEMLDMYSLRGNLVKRKYKQQQKDIERVTLDQIKKLVDRIFDKNNDVLVFMHGNFAEKQVKTIEEYKKILYKNL